MLIYKCLCDIFFDGFALCVSFCSGIACFIYITTESFLSHCVYFFAIEIGCLGREILLRTLGVQVLNKKLGVAFLSWGANSTVELTSKNFINFGLIVFIILNPVF